MKRLASFILAMLLCLSLTACGRVPSKVNLPIQETPSSLDPQIAGTNDAQSIINNCFEGLVRMDADGNIQPAVATDWSISSDGLTYTFNLRNTSRWNYTDAMKKVFGDDFQINTTVTAKDFVFALQRAIDPTTNSPFASSLWNLENAEEIYNGKKDKSTLGVTATDDYTLVIRLTKPDANLLATLASAVCMPCNQTFFEATAGKYGMEPGYTLCNGPYYYSLYSSNSGYVQLSKNSEYKGSYKTKVETVRFVLTDDANLNTALLTDESLNAAVLTDASGVSDKYSIIKYQNTTKAFLFNLSSKLVGVQALRLALVYATDSTPLTNTPATGIIPDAALITPGNSYRKATGSQSIPSFNLDTAKSYYNQGISDFPTTDDTYNMTVLCLKTDEIPVKQVIQNWQKIFGVRLNITVTTYDTPYALQKEMANGTYDVAYAPLQCDTIATNTLARFVSGSPNNVINLKNDTYDNYIKEAMDAASAEAMAPYLQRAEAALIDTGCILPITQQTSFLVYQNKLDGLTMQPSGTVYAAYTIGK